MAKPTYQAASTRVAAPLVLVVEAVVEASVVMARVVKVAGEDVVVIVLLKTDPVLLATVLFVPVVEAGWLLLVLVPAADVLMLESGTVELVGLERMGKLELLA